MSEKSQKTLFGLSPAGYGITSLVAACLVFASSPLIQVIGIFLELCILLPLVLIVVVSGLLGIGAGIYHKNWIAVVTAILGMALIGFGGLSFLSALNDF